MKKFLARISPAIAILVCTPALADKCDFMGGIAQGVVWGKLHGKNLDQVLVAAMFSTPGENTQEKLHSLTPFVRNVYDEYADPDVARNEIEALCRKNAN